MSTDTAPAVASPARRSLEYRPSLDGLRGVAVIGVIAFHLGHLQGGFLGVDLFFTLSGYLITRLLLLEHESTGRVALGAFWTRRAWRLLPAMYALLAVLAVYAALFARPDELEGIRGPGIASLLFVANWWFIASGNGYWDIFATPSPLEHVWSLSIEQQFYVVWPLIVAPVLGAARRIGRLLAVALALVAASTVVLALLSTDDVSRAYFGSFARSSSILVGAALAMVVHRGDRWIGDVARSRAAPFLGGAAVGFLVWSWVTINGATDLGFYRSGFLVHAIAVATLIALLTYRSGGPAARALSVAPLRGIGIVSYGLYLWHWPVIVLLDAERTGLTGGALLLVRLSVALAATLASYYLLERPARQVLARRVSAAVVFPVAAAVIAVALLAATVPPATDAVVGPAPVVSESAAEPNAGDATSAGTSPGAAAGDEPPAAQDEATGSATVADGEREPVPGDGATTDQADDVGSPAGAPSLLHTEPARLAPLRTPTADDPLRVLLFGDSYMYDAEPAIAAALSSTGVVAPVRSSRLGFTITGDGWEETLGELVEVHRPELIVAMWARFDAAWLETNDRAEYERRLDRAFGILTADGATLAFVGLAPSLSPGVDREPVDRTINDIFAAATAAYGDDAVYVDPDPVVAPDGEPDRWLETSAGRLLVRKPDVSHYCGDGAARFGLAIGELVERLTAVSPSDPASWWADEWRADDRYHEPAGVCSA